MTDDASAYVIYDDNFKIVDKIMSRLLLGIE